METVCARYAFTVFTPTYNRAHTLPRVYESLAQQTFRDFEWLIVDDGSVDGTRTLVERWLRDASFPIRYIHQENAGKHVAFNRGVRESRGELFLTLDSDDGCVPHALERLKFHWDRIPPEQKDRFSAVTCLCVDQRSRLVGQPFPRDPLDSDSLEFAYKYRVRGEKWGFHRTSVLRAHPFPEPQGLKFVPESVVWFAIARTYKTRFVNERLRVYHQGDAAGGRLSTLSMNVARGRLLFHRSMLEDYRDERSLTARGRLASLVNYGRYSFWCGAGIRTQLRGVSWGVAKALLPVVAPLAYVYFLRDLWHARAAAAPGAAEIEGD